nr:MAG TPA: hypothetical protein [Caudoviricetes sp.]
MDDRQFTVTLAKEDWNLVLTVVPFYRFLR